jgi:hypothetical protein
MQFDVKGTIKMKHLADVRKNNYNNNDYLFLTLLLFSAILWFSAVGMVIFYSVS